MKRGSWGALALVLVVACGDSDGGGSEDCPEGKIKVGGACVDETPSDGEPDGDDGSDGQPDGSEDGSNDGSDGSGDGDGGDGTSDPDGGTPDGGTEPVAVPFYVDAQYAPSGYMGDTGAITDQPCPAPIPAAVESPYCHRISWQPQLMGWAGVFWQYPADNWGALPGLAIAPGATHVRFKAWGAVGGETVGFGTGMAEADGFDRKRDIVLTTEPTEYFLDLTGVTYTDVVGGFVWSAGGAASTFYVADIEWATGDFPAGDPDAGVPDAGTEPDAGTDVDAGTDLDAGTDVDAGADMDGGAAPDAGSDLDGGVAPDAGQADAGGTPVGLPLPIVVDDARSTDPEDTRTYIPTGMFGTPPMVSECAGSVTRPSGAAGKCHTFSWLRGGEVYGGLHWLFGDGNWDGPALRFAPGATKVTFHAWGAAGGEVVRFIAGSGNDAFKVETSNITLTTTPTAYTIDISGRTYTDLNCPFGWVTDNDQSITFHVDNIRWE